MKNLFITSVNILPKAFYFLAICVCILSCGKDNSTPNTPSKPTPDKPTPEPPKSNASIGGTGGTLSWNNIDVVVPTGSFIVQTTIEASEKAASAVMGENEASKYYTISGIPLTFTAPIKLSIVPNAGTSGTLFMVVSYESTPTSLNKKVESFRILEGTLANGKFTAEFKPSGLQDLPADEKINITVGLVKNYQKTASQNGASGSYFTKSDDNDVQGTKAADYNFDVYHPISAASAAQKLGEYLEKSYYYLKKDYKFDFSRRTNWPVQVFMSKLEPGIYGYFSPSKFGNNYGTLEFNSELAANLPELKVTAAHEFFHLIQALYDKRNGFIKAISSSAFYWLEEASSVWFEGILSDKPDYFSPIWYSNLEAPFKGVEAGVVPSTQNHGYGMSALIKYIVETEGKQYIERIFMKEYEGIISVLLAMDEVLPTKIMDLYPDFIRKYMKSELIDVFPITYGLSNSDGEFICASEADTVKEFTSNYPALSAKIYKIKPTYDQITNTSRLTISAKNESILHIYKLQGGKLESLPNFGGGYKLHDLTDLQKNKGVIIVVVVNNSYSSASETLTARIVIDKPRAFEMCTAHLNIPDALFLDSFTNQQLSKELNIETPGVKGTYKDGIFIGIWDYKIGDDDESARISLVINEKERRIVSGEIVVTAIDIGRSSETQRMKISNIPATEWTNDVAIFKLSGSSVCNPLLVYDIYSLFTTSSTRNVSYISHTCNAAAYLKIVLYDERNFYDEGYRN